jgi:UDP-N-acetylglucosamine transferase subunit ALG13
MSGGDVHVFVTVGTDHHPFARLISWVDEWTPPPGVTVDVLVQHGATPPPCRTRGVSFLDVAELRHVLARSDVVVTQGGPGGIMDARRAGRVPIVVPRRARLGEVVDDHQVAFTRHLAARDLVRLVEGRHELHEALTAAVLDPTTVSCTPLAATSAAAARAVGHAVDEVVATRRARTGLAERLPSLAYRRRPRRPA